MISPFNAVPVPPKVKPLVIEVVVVVVVVVVDGKVVVTPKGDFFNGASYCCTIGKFY